MSRAPLSALLVAPVLAVALAACGSSSAADLVKVTVTNATDTKSEPVITVTPGKTPATTTKQDLVVGKGKAAKASDTVTVQYLGALASNGKTFDASWEHGGPTPFPLSGVVPGFATGIVGMKIGGRRLIIIPPAEGYGPGGSPPTIPANATLIFVVDLIAIQ